MHNKTAFFIYFVVEDASLVQFLFVILMSLTVGQGQNVGADHQLPSRCPEQRQERRGRDRGGERLQLIHPRQVFNRSSFTTVPGVRITDPRHVTLSASRIR